MPNDEVDGPVRLRRDDGILQITIDRPEARNAIDLATARGIEAAMDQLEGDPDLRVALLTGTGSVFCAGVDLKAFARGENTRTERRGFAGLTRQPPEKPLIAAVNGPALGGGFEIALACDLIVAADTAHFSLPEVKRGLCAGGGGLIRLPRRIPRQVAMELALIGDPLPAARAAELGLVNRVVPAESVASAALGLARAICENGPLAVVASKRVILESERWPEREGLDLQEEIIAPVRSSADASEGVAAFIEKRSPVWRAV